MIEAICVTFAMYCIIQFYIELKNDIAEHGPFLKVVSIKLVIFLSFWQNVSFGYIISKYSFLTCEALD